MENVEDWSLADFNDINTLDEYQVALRAGLSPEEALHVVGLYSRDNARTPFQWSAGANAGFTCGTPWMIVNPNFTRVNLKDQRNRADSVFSFYRRLIALRRDPGYSETVVYGETIPYLEDQRNLMSYYRKGEKTLLVIGNFQAQEQSALLPAPIRKVLINNLDKLNAQGDILNLSAWQFLVLEL